MGSTALRQDPALGCAIEGILAEEIRLEYILDRLDLLGQDGRQRCDSDRPAAELLGDRGHELAIGGVEPGVVDLHRLESHGRSRFIDPSVAVDLGVIAGPLEEPVSHRACPDRAERSPAPRRG